MSGLHARQTCEPAGIGLASGRERWRFTPLRRLPGPRSDAGLHENRVAGVEADAARCSCTGVGGELAASGDLVEGNARTDNRDVAERVQTAEMSTLTIAQIDQKIRIAQEGLARAGDAYGRNIYAQIQSEYEAYRKARLEADLKQSAQRP